MKADSTAHPLFVVYYRVSTQKQGASGLGLEAQRAAIEHYLSRSEHRVVETFTETESGKGTRNRPQLLAALEVCRKTKATLLIAKLDRLARNVHFISGLMESGVQFVAVDQPTKDRFMLHVQAAFAEEEARRISLRTKEALAAAKRRGVDIGATGRALAKKYKEQARADAEAFREPVLDAIREGCRTCREVRDALNEVGVESPGGGKWHLPNTHRTLKRLGLLPLHQTALVAAKGAA